VVFTFATFGTSLKWLEKAEKQPKQAVCRRVANIF